MALADILPSPGVLDMIGIAATLTLAGPLLFATYLFASNGSFAMAAFTALLAVVALYLPTYVIRNLLPRSIVPAPIRKVVDLFSSR